MGEYLCLIFQKMNQTFYCIPFLQRDREDVSPDKLHYECVPVRIHSKCDGQLPGKHHGGQTASKPRTLGHSGA